MQIFEIEKNGRKYRRVMSRSGSCERCDYFERVNGGVPCKVGEAPCSMHTIMREHKEAPDPST